MDKPLVSICIPTRNTERWIRDAIDSALTQTWGHCEVIVIDDGSSDSTPSILESYGEKIIYRCTPPRGGNAARNLAISFARGAWIQFLDADDYLLPDKIATQFSEVGVNTTCDLILSPELLQWWKDGQPQKPELKPKPTGRNLFEQWFRWEMPGTQGCLWRADYLRKIGNWNEEMPCCQDYELYARALWHGVSAQWTCNAGSVYRIWSETTVCRRDPVQLIEVKTKLIDAMADYLKERGLWNRDYADVAGRTCFEMGRTLFRHDPLKAELYHRERREKGLMHLAGPAAPWPYQLAYRLLGFTTSEKLARLLR